MPSELKSSSARANGAKSRGPVTPAGRARSSRNSVRHGLAASPANLPPASAVLPGESHDDFQLLLASYLAQFAPAPGVETELVHAMVAARRRLRRLQVIETALLGNEIARRAGYIENQFSEMGRDPGDHDRLAYVFKQLADNSQSLALLMRYEGVHNRSYDRAFKQLYVLQAARARLQPNEPKSPPSSLSDSYQRPSVSIREPKSVGPPVASCDNESSPQQINVQHLFP